MEHNNDWEMNKKDNSYQPWMKKCQDILNQRTFTNQLRITAGFQASYGLNSYDLDEVLFAGHDYWKYVF